ncbi:hypothetical protein V7S43_015505 [Phytophthora oleae]|uniref:F5/8 type C domain-containing protein n=1 Tax=Phytophthora oleae TaxID=2107226 RepID=A0ABD3F2B1_9STRA
MDDGAKNDYVAVMQGCGKLTIFVKDINEPPKFYISAQSARTITEPAQLDDGISENLHYTNSGGSFFGNISHDLHSGERFNFVFGYVDFSTAMTIRTNMTGGNILRLSGTNSEYFDVSVGRDGKLNVTSTSLCVQGNKELTDGGWHYLAIVYTIRDHTLRLYVEGVLDTTSLVFFGFPMIAEQAVLSSHLAMFTGWISRFHYFAGAISLSEVQELMSLSVPSFYVITDASNDPVTQTRGSAYCHNLDLRLCDLMDFDSLCINPHNNLSRFPSASQGQMNVPHCLNTDSKAEQNADNAQLACCSPYADSKLIGALSRPILRTTALTASSYLNNDKSHGFGYGGLDVLRSDNVDGSWCPASASPFEWVQISFPKATVVSRIEVLSGVDAKGNAGYLNIFQMAWRHSSSHEFSTLSQASGAAVNFMGLDNNTAVASVVIPNLLVKDFRLIPTAWIGSACLRLELYGPDSDFQIPEPLLAADGDANEQIQYYLRDSDRPSGVQIDPLSGVLTMDLTIVSQP